MSDAENEAVPELDAEAKAFLSRHRQTGEPSEQALGRGLRRLSPPAAPVLVAAPPPITRLPRRRPLISPEAMAAAAVVVVLLGAQALYLALRTPEVLATPPEAAQVEPAKVETAKAEPRKAEPTKPQTAKKFVDAQSQAVIEAWRSGDFDAARRLASRECNSEACAPLKSELATMLGFTQRLESLSDDERKQLTAFDKKLADGRDSALRRLLEKDRQIAKAGPSDAQLIASAEKLFQEAQDLKKARNFEAAALSLEKCIKIAPDHHPCYRLLGSVYAFIASRDGSAADMEKARSAYERFLEVAPSDDEYVPKVAAILQAARDDNSPPAYAGPIPTSPRVEPSELSVVVGYQGLLPVGQGIKRVALGDPSVADVKVVNDQELLVIGLRPGKTTVLVWFADGTRRSTLVKVSKPKSTHQEQVEELFIATSVARTRGDGRVAFEGAKKILQLDPGNAGAKRILSDLRDEAAELYQRAYVIRDRDPHEARMLFERVMGMTSPDDSNHAKAKLLLNELQ